MYKTNSCHHGGSTCGCYFIRPQHLLCPEQMLQGLFYNKFTREFAEIKATCSACFIYRGFGNKCGLLQI